MPGRVLTALMLAVVVIGVAVVLKTRATPGPAAPKANLSGVLEDVSGKKVDLSSFAGKPLVINLWATWCGPCKLETPQLVALYDKYKARGLNLIGISTDDKADAIRAFADEFKVQYPMLVGLGHEEFIAALGYDDTLPFSILIARDGTIAGQITGLETTADWEKRIEALLK